MTRSKIVIVLSVKEFTSFKYPFLLLSNLLYSAINFFVKLFYELGSVVVTIWDILLHSTIKFLIAKYSFLIVTLVNLSLH